MNDNGGLDLQAKLNPYMNLAALDDDNASLGSDVPNEDEQEEEMPKEEEEDEETANNKEEEENETKANPTLQDLLFKAAEAENKEKQEEEEEDEVKEEEKAIEETEDEDEGKMDTSKAVAAMLPRKNSGKSNTEEEGAAEAVVLQQQHQQQQQSSQKQTTDLTLEQLAGKRHYYENKRQLAKKESAENQTTRRKLAKLKQELNAIPAAVAAVTTGNNNSNTKQPMGPSSINQTPPDIDDVPSENKKNEDNNDEAEMLKRKYALVASIYASYKTLPANIFANIESTVVLAARSFLRARVLEVMSELFSKPAEIPDPNPAQHAEVLKRRLQKKNQEVSHDFVVYEQEFPFLQSREKEREAIQHTMSLFDALAKQQKQKAQQIVLLKDGAFKNVMNIFSFFVDAACKVIAKAFKHLKEDITEILRKFTLETEALLKSGSKALVPSLKTLDVRDVLDDETVANAGGVQGWTERTAAKMDLYAILDVAVNKLHSSAASGGGGAVPTLLTSAGPPLLRKYIQLLAGQKKPFSFHVSKTNVVLGAPILAHLDQFYNSSMNEVRQKTKQVRMDVFEKWYNPIVTKVNVELKKSEDVHNQINAKLLAEFPTLETYNKHLNQLYDCEIMNRLVQLPTKIMSCDWAAETSPFVHFVLTYPPEEAKLYSDESSADEYEESDTA